eukprot:scaffold11612_cov76-Skeletonema_dohrnii-CCMP3373.AAC.3
MRLEVELEVLGFGQIERNMVEPVKDSHYCRLPDRWNMGCGCIIVVLYVGHTCPSYASIVSIQ